MRQRQRGLDHTDRARRSHNMPDVALRRPDATERRLCGAARSGAECLCQRFDFDRIAERRRSAVRLHIRNRSRIDLRVAMRRRDHPRLTINTWRREAGLCAAVVVQPRAADDGVDLIAIPNRI